MAMLRSLGCTLLTFRSPISTSPPDDGSSPAADTVGLLSQEQLARWLPEQRDLDAYFLGPKGFMAAVKRHLKNLGVPAGQSRYEFFGPAAALE